MTCQFLGNSILFRGHTHEIWRSLCVKKVSAGKYFVIRCLH